MISHSPDVVGLFRDLTHGITDSTSKVGGEGPHPCESSDVCTLQLTAQWGDVVYRYTHTANFGRILDFTIYVHIQ